MTIPDHDSATGSMLGLAICEAISVSPDTFPDPNASLSDQYAWRDGTALALSLAESLAETKAVDPRDQMLRYASWFRYGHLNATPSCEHIDETMQKAIERFERTWSPLDPDATEDPVCLTRIAPLALFSVDQTELEHASTICTQTTHSGPESIRAGTTLASLLFHALRPSMRDTAWSLARALIDGGLGAFTVQSLHATLHAALTALLSSDDFLAGCRSAVEHGPRAAAVYGQLAGALYGEQRLPREWRHSLVHAALIRDLTSGVLQRHTAPTTA